MKLQIKMLNQKSLVIEIEETKTVYELKKELSLYPDIGVKPEQQKLIYAGKILDDDEKLSSYNIDERKFLVIMVLKQPLFGPPKPVTSKQPQTEKQEEPAKQEKPKAAEDTKRSSTPVSSTATESEAEFQTPTEIPESRKEALVRQIVGMGYPMPDVRKALAASFYNPERAIEYLVEGIPKTPSTPEAESYSDTEEDLSMTPFELFHDDPTFRSLRSALQQNPELLDGAIQRIGETNPSLLNLISENQQEFLSMLIEGVDDTDDDGEEMEDDDEN